VQESDAHADPAPHDHAGASGSHGKPKAKPEKSKGVKKSRASVKAKAPHLDFYAHLRERLTLPMNFDTASGKRVTIKGSGQRGRYIVTLSCPPLNALLRVVHGAHLV